MDLILNRYRNLTALVAAILVQLVLLAYQVKSNQEVRLIRVWAVSAVTPLARLLEGGRSGTVGFFKDYFVLLDVREQNKRLQTDLNRIQLENQYLRSELDTAERGRALSVFQEQTRMKTVGARIIGNSPGSNGRVVLIDRGSASGIQPGMAVITPDGIVGKIVSSYPTASNLLLITDPSFAAGVISQKNRVHGTLKGAGNSSVLVDYVQNEQNVEVGEWFYTAGDDRIFPKGLPAGNVTAVRSGRTVKEIFLSPSGLQNGLEDVLVILEGDHKPIPELPAPNQSVHLQPLPPAEGDPADAVSAARSSGAQTDLDREVERARRIGEDQHHVFGERGRGAPDFNKAADPGAARPPAAPAAPPAKSATPPKSTAVPSPGASSPASPPAASPVSPPRP
ncbi:MAG: rod shape-determining protein MreC [Bryobacterales bacterium]|nr:rod shape-determining protein MreC [Bryobacterales bacterium]